MADSLSIICISDIILPDREGGSGTVSWELSKRLVARGHHIAVLTRGRKGQPDDELIDSIGIHRFFDNPLRGRRIYKQLVRELSPDVILVHQPFAGLSTLGISARAHAPLVYIFHSPWAEEYQIRTHDLGRSSLRGRVGTWARKRAEGKLLKSAAAIVTLSDFMASRLTSWHTVPEDKITIVPGGVDLKRFNTDSTRESARSGLDLPNDRFIILTVRNLVSRMGLETLVTAMRSVVKARPDALLVIGGRGYLKDKLETLAREDGLENNVRLVGFIDEEHLPSYFRAADVFVLPTRLLEGFGLVTLEALACGTPVLGTPVGGTVEILGKLDKNFLFEDCEAENIAAGIRAFLKKAEDPAVLQKRCRSFVERNYSWERFADGIEHVIEDAQ